MIIIDSHAHFWKEPPDRSLVFRDHQEPIGHEQFVKDMDIAGVDKLIQLTRGLMGFDNSYSIEGATRFPNRIRVMGRFNAAASDAVAQLRGWLEQPYVVGIRMMTTARDEAPLFENEALSERDYQGFQHSRSARRTLPVSEVAVALMWSSSPVRNALGTSLSA